MPFSRPSLEILVSRTLADVQARLNAGAPLLAVSNLAVLARVLAGAVHGLYGYLSWIADQILPDTAEDAWLERHAANWGVDRVAATYAAGALTVSGVPGSVVLIGSQWRRADGALFAATAATTLVGASAGVPVRALAAGAAGNTDAGQALTLVSPLAGVAAGAAVDGAAITGGADAENDASLRARLLLRLRRSAQGGSAADYEDWTRAAHPAVTRAWCFPEELGAGAVTVRCMTDGASADGIPDPAVITVVQAALDQARPVTAAVTVVAPVAAPLAFDITASPGTAAVRTAITAALAALIRAEAEPGGTLLLSHIRSAISAAAGEYDHTLTTPDANVVAAPGSITTLGTVTWT